MVRLRALSSTHARTRWQPTAEVMKENTDAAFLGCLRLVVRGPILLVDLLFRDGDGVGFNDRAIGENVPLVDDHRGVVVLASEPAFCVVWTCTGFLVEVDAIGGIMVALLMLESVSEAVRLDPFDPNAFHELESARRAAKDAAKSKQSPIEKTNFLKGVPSFQR